MKLRHAGSVILLQNACPYCMYLLPYPSYVITPDKTTVVQCCNTQCGKKVEMMPAITLERLGGNDDA